MRWNWTFRDSRREWGSDEHYDCDAGFLNRLIEIDGEPVRVIGVLPKDFEMPRLQAADVLVPRADDEAAQRRANPETPRWAFARLKPGGCCEGGS